MGKVTVKMSKKFDKAVKETKILSTLRLFFGVVDDKKKIDGMLVIDYMNINELGAKSKNIPSRPFFRKVLFQQRVAYMRIAKEQFKLVARGEKTAKDSMITIGEYLKNAVIGSIVNGSYAPNKPSTIKAKGGKNKPLIDKLNGLNAVGFKIYKGKTIIYSDIGGTNNVR